MIDRVSSYGSMASLMSEAMRLQAKYAKTQQQTSSGLVSETYDGLAKDAQRLLNLDAQSQRITTQIEAMSEATNRMTMMQEATGAISDLLEKAMSHLTQALSGGEGSTSATVTAEQAQGWLDELSGLLNMRYGQGYVFGGTVTDVAPVNLNALGYDYTQTEDENTGYYQGNQVQVSVRASEHLRVAYGVTADNAAFEEAIRALTLMATQSGDQEALEKAHALMTSAVDKVADVTAVLGTKADTLANETATQTAMLDYLDSSIADIRSVDIAAATVQLTQIETQLEASYGTLAKLMQLKLSDYLG